MGPGSSIRPGRAHLTSSTVCTRWALLVMVNLSSELANGVDEAARVGALGYERDLGQNGVGGDLHAVSHLETTAGEPGREFDVVTAREVLREPLVELGADQYTVARGLQLSHPTEPRAVETVTIEYRHLVVVHSHVRELERITDVDAVLTESQRVVARAATANRETESGCGGIDLDHATSPDRLSTASGSMRHWPSIVLCDRPRTPRPAMRRTYCADRPRSCAVSLTANH